MVGASGVRGFETVPFKPAEATAEGVDIYVMDTGKDCFGWLRSFENKNTEGTKISLSKKGKRKFEVSWFDTWTGKTIKTETIKMNKGKLILAVPKTETAQTDIAFKIRKI